jgi:Ca2+-binding RTX toxin-like protein
MMVLGAPRPLRAALGALATCAALGVAAQSAGAAAGTAGVTGSTLTFQAGPQTVNDLRLVNAPRQTSNIGLAETSPTPIQAATGCVQSSWDGVPGTPFSVLCAIAPIRRIVVLLGDESDVQTVLSPDTMRLPLRVNAGTGNDTLGGGAGPDVLIGGPGTNIARGQDGNDRLLMRNGVRDGLIDCGTGIDTAVIDRTDPRPVACETVQRP